MYFKAVTVYIFLNLFQFSLQADGDIAKKSKIDSIPELYHRF